MVGIFGLKPRCESKEGRFTRDSIISKGQVRQGLETKNKGLEDINHKVVKVPGLYWGKSLVFKNYMDLKCSNTGPLAVSRLWYWKPSLASARDILHCYCLIGRVLTPSSPPWIKTESRKPEKCHLTSTPQSMVPKQKNQCLICFLIVTNAWIWILYKEGCLAHTA